MNSSLLNKVGPGEQVDGDGVQRLVVRNKLFVIELLFSFLNCPSNDDNEFKSTPC